MKEVRVADPVYHVTLDPWQTLANAIIKQAADDYVSISKQLHKHCTSLQSTPASNKQEQDNIEKLIEKAEEDLDSLLDFFYSDWFCVLTDLDGDELVERMEHELI